jgi:hypothetical protein
MKIDLFVRAVREPRKIIKVNQKRTTTLYFTYMRGGTPKDGKLKLGTFVELIDVMNHTNFYLFLMNSFRASGVKNEDSPLKGIWRLQHCLALPRWHVIIHGSSSIPSSVHLDELSILSSTHSDSQ